jgi:hypothetical protein
MTTADYALIVSLCSAAIALAGFVWNVWQKFIYPKARLRVRFFVAVIINGTGEGPPWPTYLCLSVTNHGPTEVVINTVGITILRMWPWQRPQHAIVNPIANIMMPDIATGPFGGGLPRTLKVGESHSLYFPYDSRSFGRERLGRVGLSDNFDRFHDAPRRELRKVKGSLDKAFVDQPYVSLHADAPSK